MEITLEQIDLIRQRTGAGYKEAREALESTGGSLVDALVMLESDTYPGDGQGQEYPTYQDSLPSAEPRQESRSPRLKSNKVMAGLMDLGKKSKIKITLPGERKVEIPAVLGVAGVVLAPKIAALSGMALLLAKSSLSVDYSGGNGQPKGDGEQENS